MMDDVNLGTKLLSIKGEIDKIGIEGNRIHMEIKNTQAEILQELAKDDAEGAEELAKKFGLPLKLNKKEIDEVVHLA